MKKDMDETLVYYDNNAEKFSSETVDVEFTDTQERFLNYLSDDACILDFGCGAGRDTKYFLDRGYRVEPTDGSAELCKIAEKTAGVPVRHMLFSELNEFDKYDAIWACSSILHLRKSQLQDVFGKMIRAIKCGGYIYTSFKYGEFEGYRNGRYFTDFTEEGFERFLGELDGIEIVEEWVSSDVRPGRQDEKWLNMILRTIRR